MNATARALPSSPGDLYFDTQGQPPHSSAYVFRRTRELTLDRLPALLEVPPALVLDRDGGARPNEATQVDRVLGGQRIAHRPGHRELHSSKVQERHVDLQAVGDLAHTVVKHGVAGDPEHVTMASADGSNARPAGSRLSSW